MNDSTPVTTAAPPSPATPPILIRAAWIGATLLAGLLVPGFGAVIVGTVGTIFAAKRHRDRTLAIVLIMLTVLAALATAWLLSTTFFVRTVVERSPVGSTG